MARARRSLIAEREFKFKLQLPVGVLAALLLAGVVSVAGAAQTVSVGSGSVAVGETVEVPIVLDHAPWGLAGYIMTISLSNGEVAKIEGVEFVAFRGASRAEISPDGSSVEIRAADFEAAVGPGDTDITLARLTIRGLAEGTSELLLQLDQFDADDGTDLLPFTATQGGSLTVIAGPTPPPTGPPTVSLGSATVALGSSVQIPVVLDRAPQGLSGYIVTIWLVDPTVAKIEGVEFVAFSYASRAEISPDGSSVEIRAADLGAAVGPGDTDITLARLTLRGLAEGTSELALQLNKFDADDGTDLLPSTGVARGSITVTAGVSDTNPPQFSNPQPSPGSTVGTGQPTVSIEISDDYGVEPSSIQMEITDSSGAQHIFTAAPAPVGAGTTAGAASLAPLTLSPSSPSPLPSPSPSASPLPLTSGLLNLSVKATVDLRAAGITLADGPVTVTVRAEDRAGNEGHTSWSFTVSTGEGDLTPPQFSEEQPAPGATITTAQPTISVVIQDAESGVDRDSIQLRVESGEVSWAFTSGSPGASFDPASGTFSVDLAAAGVVLAAGPVTVEVSASDNAGNLGSTSWSFSISIEPGPEPPAIEPGDVNGDGVVDRKDVNLVSKFVFTGKGLDEAQRRAANVARPCGPPDDRSTINFKDVIHLRQAAVGIRAEFECFPGVAIAKASADANPSRSRPATGVRVKRIAAYPNPIVGGMDTAHFVVEVEEVEAKAKVGTEAKATGAGKEEEEGGELGAKLKAEVEVFDLAGRRLLRLESEFTTGGSELTLTWHLLDDRGEPLANGVYLYVVTVKDEGGKLVTARSKPRKLVVLRQ